MIIAARKRFSSHCIILCTSILKTFGADLAEQTRNSSSLLILKPYWLLVPISITSLLLISADSSN